MRTEWGSCIEDEYTRAIAIQWRNATIWFSSGKHVSRQFYQISLRRHRNLRAVQLSLTNTHTQSYVRLIQILNYFPENKCFPSISNHAYKHMTCLTQKLLHRLYNTTINRTNVKNIWYNQLNLNTWANMTH